MRQRAVRSVSDSAGVLVQARLPEAETLCAVAPSHRTPSRRQKHEPRKRNLTTAESRGLASARDTGAIRRRTPRAGSQVRVRSRGENQSHSWRCSENQNHCRDAPVAHLLVAPVKRDDERRFRAGSTRVPDNAIASAVQQQANMTGRIAAIEGSCSPAPASSRRGRRQQRMQ